MKQITNNILAFDGDSHQAPDPTDVANANAFEQLVRNNEIFVTTTPDQRTIDDVPDRPNPPEQQSNDMEAGNSEAMSEVVIDCFPSPTAGAPIPGMSHGSSANESLQGVSEDSVWSPFTSQCDWLVAYWAKMHSPSVSAVSDLLAIPEVCTYLYSGFISLIHGPRS
jgi:hypothetical protein